MKLIVDKQIININQVTTLEQIAKEYFINQKIYAGIVNGKLKPLQEIIDKDTTIEWVLASSITGKQIYERTLTFLFIVATKQLFNDAKITVEFTFQDGLYCTIEKENHLTPKDVEKIKLQMQKLVTKKSKITHCSLPKEEAINFFKQHGLEDKAELLHYRKKENCSVYTLEGFSDYFYGFMLPDTSYLNHFSLQFFAPGIRLGQYDVQLEYSKLFTIMKEYEDWGQLIGVPTVAKLNEKIVQGNINELMLMSEAMIEKWNNGEYGEQNANDMWGLIQNEVEKGWFVPSRGEWSAFAEELGITTNYSSFGLSRWYWSSSQSNTNNAYNANFNAGYVGYFTVNFGTYVRLSTTF